MKVHEILVGPDRSISTGSIGVATIYAVCSSYLHLQHLPNGGSSTYELKPNLL